MTTETAGRRIRATITIYPSADQRRRFELIKNFLPIDARELLRDALMSRSSRRHRPTTPEQLYKNRIQEQQQTLLDALEVPLDHPNPWQFAFFRLAEAKLGMGHLTIRALPSKPKNKWNHEADTFLLRRMFDLTSAGMSDQKALETIASNPNDAKRLPYLGGNGFSKGYNRNKPSVPFQRALARHWQHIKHKSREKLETAIGRPVEGWIETLVQEFDFKQNIPTWKPENKE